MNRTVAAFAGIPAEAAAAGRGPVARDPVYRAAFRVGEEWFAAHAGTGAGPLALDAPDPRSRDVAATLHGCAAWDALLARGGAPDALAEHSLGLYAALYAAGAVSLEGALAIALEAARAIIEAGAVRPGALLAVTGFPPEALAALARDAAAEAGPGAVCTVATFNTAHQAVLGGDRAAVAAAERLARTRGALDARPVPAAAALHTPALAAAGARLARFVEARIEVAPPRLPVLSHSEVEWIRTEADVRRALTDQLARPVRFGACVERLRREGFGRLIDLGPGDVLARLARWTFRDMETVALDGRDEAALERAFGLGGSVAWTRR